MQIQHQPSESPSVVGSWSPYNQCLKKPQLPIKYKNPLNYQATEEVLLMDIKQDVKSFEEGSKSNSTLQKMLYDWQRFQAEQRFVCF